MMEERFETSKTPSVSITESLGEVKIGGWMGSAVKVKGSRFNASMEKLDEVTITSEEDLEVTVPAGATLSLGDIHGTLAIKHLDGFVLVKECRADVALSNVHSVKVQTAHGDLTGENLDDKVTIIEAMGNVRLRNVGDVRIDRVHNDVALNYVRGVADIGETGGTVDVHTVNGDLSVTKAARHANLSNLGGRNNLADIGGEIRLVGGLASGEHHLSAAGNIIVRWPVDAPLTLTASASAIVTQIHLDGKSERVEDDITIVTGHIEEGNAHVWLKTPGLIGVRAIHSMSDEHFNLEDFIFDFEAPPVETAAVVPPDVQREASEAPESSELRVELSTSISAALIEAGLELEPEALRQVVARAVAESLDKLGDAGMKYAALALVGSASRRRAETAIREVKESLRKAKDTMETARQKALQPAGPESEPTGEAESKQPPRDVADERMISEEQMQILKLLENGQITVTQAHTLLRSLKE